MRGVGSPSQRRAPGTVSVRNAWIVPCRGAPALTSGHADVVVTCEEEAAGRSRGRALSARTTRPRGGEHAGRRQTAETSISGPASTRELQNDDRDARRPRMIPRPPASRQPPQAVPGAVYRADRSAGADPVASLELDSGSGRLELLLGLLG